MSPSIGITGATGQLGRKVVASLSRHRPAEEIVAIVRDPAKAADLGVAVRQADYGDLPGLEAAFSGLDTVLLISSSAMGTRQTEHDHVVRAAQRAGVRRIVYTSLLHAERWGIAFAEDHLATERWIRASGLDFTILRNGWYWENHTAGLPVALAHGGIVGSAGSARISWASRQDHADAAAAVLSQPGHEARPMSWLATTPTPWPNWPPTPRGKAASTSSTVTCRSRRMPNSCRRSACRRRWPRCWPRSTPWVWPRACCAVKAACCRN